jgi:hypothetical protein
MNTFKRLALTGLVAASCLLPSQSANAFFGWMNPFHWFGGPGWWGNDYYYPYWGGYGPYGYPGWGGYGYPYGGYGYPGWGGYGYPYGGYPYWGGYNYYPYPGGYAYNYAYATQPAAPTAPAATPEAKK